MTEIDKSQLGYLTKNQKIFFQALKRNFEFRDEDMINTIIHMQKHPESLNQTEYSAMKYLSSAEKNQVICELLLPF